MGCGASAPEPPKRELAERPDARDRKILLDSDMDKSDRENEDEETRRFGSNTVYHRIPDLVRSRHLHGVEPNSIPYNVNAQNLQWPVTRLQRAITMRNELIRREGDIHAIRPEEVEILQVISSRIEEVSAVPAF